MYLGRCCATGSSFGILSFQGTWTSQVPYKSIGHGQVAPGIFFLKWFPECRISCKPRRFAQSQTCNTPPQATHACSCSTASNTFLSSLEHASSSPSPKSQLPSWFAHRGIPSELPQLQLPKMRREISYGGVLVSLWRWTTNGLLCSKSQLRR